MTNVGDKHTAWSASLLVLSLIAAGFGMLFLTEVALAQQPGDVLDTQTFGAPDPDDVGFGYSVANLGDVNGDGIADLAVGATGQGPDNVRFPTDHVWIIFMGEDGRPLADQSPQRIPTTPPDCGSSNPVDGCWTGYIVEGIGDIDGDGVPDLAVGAPNYTLRTVRGAVNIMLLNPDGTVKGGWEPSAGTGSIVNQGDFGGEHFGSALANLGDIDDDPETATALAVAALGDFSGPGSISVLFLDTSGEVVRSELLTAITASDDTDVDLTNVGDIDGDGIPDLAYTDDEGLIIALLNADGSFKGSANLLGYQRANVAGVGDLDGDGIPDLAVEAEHGIEILFLFGDGEIKDSRTTGASGASSLAGLGDLAGDETFALAAGTGGGVQIHFMEVGHTIISSEEERELLVALYNSTDGDNWDNNENWISDEPVSTWFGVEVLGGRVTELDLKDNNLNGTIPEELGNLPNLRLLWLQRNQLSGEIPAELGTLFSLQELRLQGNQLSGVISMELGNLRNLSRLLLGFNQLSGAIPAELGNLSNLRTLFLQSNQLSGSIPAELGSLSELDQLALSNNQLSGEVPEELGNLGNLIDLYLYGNPLSGAIPLSFTNLSSDSFFRLPALRDFWFNDTGLCEPPDESFQSWLASVENAQTTGHICTDQPGATLIVSSSGWKSNAFDVGDAPDGWQAVGFNDDDWPNARAPYPGIDPVDDPDVIFPDSEARPMWHDPDNSSDGTTGAINAFFRRTFELDYSSGATFTGQARIWTDDDFAFYVNGTQVAADENNDRGPLVAVDISNHLMDGENVFAIRAVDGRLADPFDRVYEVLLFEARIEPVDGTPPVCGEIETVTDARDRLTEIRTTATDDESGIARADFLRLNNLRGFVNGQGPFSEDEVVHFDPTTTSMVSIRGERISFTTGGAIVVRVTNGAGLTSDCDPVAMSLVAEAPESFGLEASYPNPFRSVTTIPFRLAEPGHVTLTVYDALGREVARLVDREMAAGAYEVQWTAPRLASGTYFYRVEAGDFRATRRMSIVR